MEIYQSLIVAIASGVVSGLVAYGGIRVELRWHRADIEELRRRVERVEQRCDTTHFAQGA